LEVQFFDLNSVDEKLFTRVVCVCKYNNKWLFSKHKERKSWEIPGGHIEENETWQQAAKRELFEETGANKIKKLTPICIYKISSYALLCFAEIESFETLPNFEMSEIGLFKDLPNNLTYPDTHKQFFKIVKDKLNLK